MDANNDTAGIWRSITRRMVQAVQEHFGLVIVSMDVVVLNGEPIMWRRPVLTSMEPRSNDAVKHLTPEQLAIVCQWMKE